MTKTDSDKAERALIVERAIQVLVDFHEYPDHCLGIARTMVIEAEQAGLNCRDVLDWLALGIIDDSIRNPVGLARAKCKGGERMTKKRLAAALSRLPASQGNLADQARQCPFRDHVPCAPLVRRQEKAMCRFCRIYDASLAAIERGETEMQLISKSQATTCKGEKDEQATAR